MDTRGTSQDTRTGRLDTLMESVQLGLARALFLIVTAMGVLVFVVLDPPFGEGRTPGLDWAVRLLAFVVLASLPTWLYVRFLGVKLGTVYVEYVLNLYRLGVDEVHNLPEPPVYSEYYLPWSSARLSWARKHGRTHDQAASVSSQSVYDRKFQAYFGRRPLGGDVDGKAVGQGSILPIFVTWAAFAAGWLTIVLDEQFLALRAPSGAAAATDVLRFAFLGAYVFSLQLTVRAYFQNDLRSGTYVAALERLAVVLILVGVIHVLWGALPSMTASGAVESGFAFVVGSFPIVGQQWLNQLVGQHVQTKIQSLYSRHPLDELDGMNVWYQARLLEEGVEDVQNLATANLVDVVLHSRAPVGRLVDWVDQALLLQPLPPWPADRPPRKRRRMKWRRDETEPEPDSRDPLVLTLHRLGVRTATDLLELYSPLTDEALDEVGGSVHGLWPQGKAENSFHDRMLDVAPDSKAAQAVGHRMLALLRCLASEPNLRLVRNWQRGMRSYVTVGAP